jgi:hypothetical protein
MKEDLRQLAGAELYLELWCGHPGTANRRVTPNGRTTYPLPNFAGQHCAHCYPTLPVKLTDLVAGHNAIQFVIVDNACLRAILKPDHPDLKELGLADFTATVRATPSSANPEVIQLALEAPPGLRERIAAVDFEGHYHGYDENGDTRATDWHGYTKHRQPVAHLGTARQAPFARTWDLSLLPAQKEMAARAVVRFRDAPNLLYVTAPVGDLATPERKRIDVTIRHATDMPAPFLSRVNRKKTCTIALDVDPNQVEHAELHVVVWDGGAGDVKAYFTFNGRPLPVAGTGKHDVLYSRMPVEPTSLRRGANTIELLSDTTHHGIEVLLPGPALVVRYRK